MVGLILVQSLQSCYYDNEQFLYGENVCDTTVAVTYNEQIKSIMDLRCASSACHGGPYPANDVNLTTYSGVRYATESLGLLCSIRHEAGCLPMPKDEEPLSSCDISLIEKWQRDGYPEN